MTAARLHQQPGAGSTRGPQAGVSIGQPREQAIGCRRRCGRTTWNISAVCTVCAADLDDTGLDDTEREWLDDLRAERVRVDSMYWRETPWTFARIALAERRNHLDALIRAMETGS